MLAISVNNNTLLGVALIIVIVIGVIILLRYLTGRR